MKSYAASRSPCPIGRASRLLGDRWVLLLLRELFLGCDRFDGFLERLAISRATLTARLEWMTEAGVVAREPAGARRARYVLTDAGRALAPTLDAMRVWGDAWLPPAKEKGAPADGRSAPSGGAQGVRDRRAG